MYWNNNAWEPFPIAHQPVPAQWTQPSQPFYIANPDSKVPTKAPAYLKPHMRVMSQRVDEGVVFQPVVDPTAGGAVFYMCPLCPLKKLYKRLPQLRLHQKRCQNGVVTAPIPERYPDHGSQKLPQSDFIAQSSFMNPRLATNPNLEDFMTDHDLLDCLRRRNPNAWINLKNLYATGVRSDDAAAYAISPHINRTTLLSLIKNSESKLFAAVAPVTTIESDVSIPNHFDTRPEPQILSQNSESTRLSYEYHAPLGAENEFTSKFHRDDATRYERADRNEEFPSRIGNSQPNCLQSEDRPQKRPNGYTQEEIVPSREKFATSANRQSPAANGVVNRQIRRFSQVERPANLVNVSPLNKNDIGNRNPTVKRHHGLDFSQEFDTMSRDISENSRDLIPYDELHSANGLYSQPDFYTYPAIGNSQGEKQTQEFNQCEASAVNFWQDLHFAERKVEAPEDSIFPASVANKRYQTCAPKFRDPRMPNIADDPPDPGNEGLIGESYAKELKTSQCDLATTQADSKTSSQGLWSEGYFADKERRFSEEAKETRYSEKATETRFSEKATETRFPDKTKEIAMKEDVREYIHAKGNTMFVRVLVRPGMQRPASYDCGGIIRVHMSSDVDEVGVQYQSVPFVGRHKSHKRFADRMKPQFEKGCQVDSESLAAEELKDRKRSMVPARRKARPDSLGHINVIKGEEESKGVERSKYGTSSEVDEIECWGENPSRSSGVYSNWLRHRLARLSVLNFDGPTSPVKGCNRIRASNLTLSWNCRWRTGKELKILRDMFGGDDGFREAGYLGDLGCLCQRCSMPRGEDLFCGSCQRLLTWLLGLPCRDGLIKYKQFYESNLWPGEVGWLVDKGSMWPVVLLWPSYEVDGKFRENGRLWVVANIGLDTHCLVRSTQLLGWLAGVSGRRSLENELVTSTDAMWRGAVHKAVSNFRLGFVNCECLKVSDIHNCEMCPNNRILKTVAEIIREI